MKRQEFDELVCHIEDRFAGRQKALERVTSAWLRFGLAGILAWLAALWGLGTLSFAGGIMASPEITVWLIGLGVLLIVYALSQTGYVLLVEAARPEGRALRPGEAPRLLAMLDALRGELQCRPFDEIRLTMKFNAGVREIPRLGLLGWLHSELEIGLPLVLALAPEEFRAVLAHEFAHLSSGHGHSGNRIYRLHRTWCNIVERMQQPAHGTLERAIRGAIRKFLNWYWPRLHARAMVLSRMQELQADRIAGQISGPATMVSALWRIECLNAWLAEQFWPDLYHSAEQTAEPPENVLEQFERALQSPPSPDDASRWVQRGLSRATDNDDSHPAFADRAQALGKDCRDLRQAGFPAVPILSAASALLEPDLGEIRQELAEMWRVSTRAAWRERQRQAAARARRQEWAGPAQPALPAGDLVALWESAQETANIYGPAAAEPLLRAVLEREPGHPGASVLFGHSRLRAGDDIGERLLLSVLDRADERWMHAACGALEEHYQATGQIEKLRQVRARLDQYEADSREARRERSAIMPGDSILPHGLSKEQIEPVRRHLAAESACTAAWLVRKDLRYFPDRPLFLLCVASRSSPWMFQDSEAERELVRRLSLQMQLPGQLLVITRRGKLRRLAARIMSRADSKVFSSDQDAVPASRSAGPP